MDNIVIDSKSKTSGLASPPPLELLCTRKRGPKSILSPEVPRIPVNLRMHAGVNNDLIREAERLGTSKTALLEAILATHLRSNEQKRELNELVKKSK